jgi:hypothetical protein
MFQKTIKTTLIYLYNKIEILFPDKELKEAHVQIRNLLEQMKESWPEGTYS